MSNQFIPAKRLDNVAFSAVRVVLAKATELQNQGRDIVHFGIGEPDFDTPELIVKETAKALLEEKQTHYASNLGDMSLRKSISQRLKDKNGITADPVNEIIVTVGAAEALFDGIMAVVNPGDEVILFSPAFLSYENIVNMAGGIPVEIPLKPENNYQIDINVVKSSITDKTRMLVLNNPHNPSGVVFEESAVRELCKLALNHNFMILSDEIYDEITYGDAKCLSPASLPEMRNHVITINGFSKAYAMTGWRLGYIVADKAIMPAILKVHQYSTNCVPTFIQLGAARAMLTAECLEDVATMRDIFNKRRTLLINCLDKIDGIQYVAGEGAFYMLIDISSFGLSDTEFASRLLEEEGVATIPGSGFGKNFLGHVRISYAASEAQIEKGMARFHNFCRKLSGIAPE